MYLALSSAVPHTGARITLRGRFSYLMTIFSSSTVDIIIKLGIHMHNYHTHITIIVDTIRSISSQVSGEIKTWWTASIGNLQGITSWVMLKVDRPIFDWANTFYTGSLSKKRRYVFEDFFYFAIFWEIWRVEKLRIWVKTIFLKMHNSCSI